MLSSTRWANWMYQNWNIVRKYFDRRTVSKDTLLEFSKWFLFEKKYATSSYRKVYMELVNYCEWLEARGSVPTTKPLIDGLLPMPVVIKSKPIIQESEYARLRENFKGTPYYYLLTLLWTYGMRRNDAIYLTWDKVDLDNDIIRFVPWKTRRKTSTEVELPITEEIRVFFEALKQDPDNSVYVCNALAKNGYHAAGENATSLIAMRCQKLGMRRINPHLFRHTRASRMLNGENAVDIYTAKEILGISTLTTLQKYVKVSIANKTRAIKM